MRSFFCRSLCGMAALLAWGCTPPPTQPPQSASVQPSGTSNHIVRSAFAGTRQRVGYYAELNPDCSSAGIPAVRTEELPTHGNVVTAQGEAYTSYPSSSQRYSCNTIKTRMIEVFYTSVPGYRGSDEFVLRTIFSDGMARTDKYTVNVE